MSGNSRLRSRLIDDVLVNQAGSTILVAHVGDSLTTGSSSAPGGSRIAFHRRLRSVRSDVVGWGPVVQGLTQSLTLPDLRCAGYPGETIAQVTTRLQPAGSLGTYAATATAPRVLFHQLGTNDMSAGTSSSTALTSMATYCALAQTTFPSAKHVLCSIPKFYSPAAPTGGLSAANANVAAFNTGLAALATQMGSNWSFIDSAAELSASHAHTDGTHLTPEGQAIVGTAQARELERLFPVRSGPASPRPFTLRAAKSAASFMTTTTDNVTVTDSGFELAASNFAFLAELRITGVAAGTTNAIAQCTPSGQNYSHGWLVSYDASSNNIGVYLASLGPSVIASVPADALAGRPMWLIAHGDRSAGVVSVYLAYYPSGGDQLAIGCIGQATGVSAWAAGDASGQLVVGKNASFGGFYGQIRRVEWSRGSLVPDVNGIVAAIEAAIYEGKSIPGCSGRFPLDEGTGTSVTTGNAATGTLTGGWATAGSIPWPCDEKGSYAIVSAADGSEWDFVQDRRVRAVFDATYAGSITQSGGVASQWSAAYGDLTAVQSTAGKKPAYNGTGINGRPTLDFDGVDDFFSLNKFGAALGTEAIAPLGDQLFVAVVKPSGAMNTGRFLLDVATGRTICAVNDSSIGNYIGYYGAGWSSSGQVATTNAQVLAWEYRAGLGTRIFLNGTQIGSTDNVNSVPTAIGSVAAIGSNNGGVSSFYSGSLAMLVIASGKIDDALRARITRKCGLAYGLPVV